MSPVETAAFPAGIAGPSLWYLLLYGLTLLLHVAFMNYVLWGAIVLAAAGLHRGTALRTMAHVAKDWLPSALSGAITAGIAPLLFVQILYQQEYYTANLLSFHRWMAILPVLVAAYYMLYFVKAKRMAAHPRSQAALSACVAACIVFVAWSWIENHLLSLDRGAWRTQYAEGRMVYASAAILPRLAFFALAAVPMWAVLLAAQLRAGASGTSRDDAQATLRPLAIAAAVAVPAAVAMAMPVLRGPLATAGVEGTPQDAWRAVILAGGALSLAGWILVAKRRVFAGLAASCAIAGTVAFWLAVIALRESTRWAIAGSTPAIERHAEVGTTAGLAVFVVFLAAGIAVTAWIWMRVARALRAAG